MLAEADMHIGLVCGPVGRIDWQEGDFTLNGRYDQRERDFTLNCRYQAHSLDIACACKQLAGEAEGMC